MSKEQHSFTLILIANKMPDSNVMESGIFYAKEVIISPTRTDVLASCAWYLIPNGYDI